MERERIEMVLLAAEDRSAPRIGAHLGTLIVLGPERISSTNPKHLALGERVQRILEERGLLRVLLPRQA